MNESTQYWRRIHLWKFDIEMDLKCCTYFHYSSMQFHQTGYMLRLGASFLILGVHLCPRLRTQCR